MMQQRIFITSQDRDRLRTVLRKTRDPLGMDRPYLELLSAELDRAVVVPREAIHPDVVTMNSTVRVQDRESGRSSVLTLVYPERAALESDQLSVLAPLGTALLGYRVGEVITFEVPSGMRSCEIVEVVYQPEAAGDLHL
jgi:regulator of nucleoside diphosphate kinase